MTYNFTVCGDRITLSEIHGAASGSMNYYHCAFTFSSEWDGLEKFAVFTDGDITYTVMLTGNACPIPAELIQKPCRLSIGVYGSALDSSQPVRISTDTEHIDIREGAYRDGSAPSAPEPALWELYYEQAADKAAKVAVDAAIAAADEAKAEIDRLNSAAVAELEVHTQYSENPHNVTAEQIGLGNVDNTSDIDKPLSTPAKEYIDELMGDVSSVLDSIIVGQESIIAMQNSLIGGDRV